MKVPTGGDGEQSPKPASARRAIGGVSRFGADLHARQAALIFTSGYVANDAALSTLAREMPGMVVFSDALTMPR